MTVKTEPNYTQDLFLHEYADNRYTREEATLSNDRGAISTYEVGTILEDSGNNVIDVGAANAANTSAILLDRVVDLASGGTKTVSVLRRGPAIVNSTILVNDSGANATTVEATLSGLGIIYTSEPTKSTTQTT